MADDKAIEPAPIGADEPDSSDNSVKNTHADVNDIPKHDHHAHRDGADAALDLLNETGGISRPFDAKANKRLIRRIDTHIMPLICTVYFLQYIDKTAVSYASVTGIQQSTGLKGNEFNWVASIFFFGQLGFQFPTVRLLQVFPLAKYVSVNVT